VTQCSFPDRQKTPPTTIADRVCECADNVCDNLILAAYEELLCRKPNSSEATAHQQGLVCSSLRMDEPHVVCAIDCCAGVSDVELRANLKVSDEYTRRHTCPGCFASACTCDKGYIQVSCANLSGLASCSLRCIAGSHLAWHGVQCLQWPDRV